MDRHARRFDPPASPPPPDPRAPRSTIQTSPVRQLLLHRRRAPLADRHRHQPTSTATSTARIGHWHRALALVTYQHQHNQTRLASWACLHIPDSAPGTDTTTIPALCGWCTDYADLDVRRSVCNERGLDPWTVRTSTRTVEKNVEPVLVSSTASRRSTSTAGRPSAGCRASITARFLESVKCSCRHDSARIRPKTAHSRRALSVKSRLKTRFDTGMIGTKVEIDARRRLPTETGDDARRLEGFQP